MIQRLLVATFGIAVVLGLAGMGQTSKKSGQPSAPANSSDETPNTGAETEERVGLGAKRDQGQGEGEEQDRRQGEEDREGHVWRRLLLVHGGGLRARPRRKVGCFGLCRRTCAEPDL